MNELEQLRAENEALKLELKKVSQLTDVDAGAAIDWLINNKYRLLELSSDISRHGVVIEKLPKRKVRRRADRTYGQWVQHVGGRYQDNNPAGFYEFGSMFAVAALIKQVHHDGFKAGWNECIDVIKGGESL